MRRFVQHLHTYLSLFSFAGLLVFGLVGLHATVSPAWEARLPGETSRWERPFEAPIDAADEALAEHVRAQFLPRLATPFLQHDAGGRLRLDFYGVNGLTRVTVDESRGKLLFEQTRVDALEYLNRIHATSTGTPSPDWRVRAWVWYNELAVWSLFGMVATGVWLWLTSRFRHRGAAVGALTGAALFAVLYWVLQ